MLEATGRTAAEIDELADRYLRAQRVVVTWAMGVIQQQHGVATIQEIINLLLLRGTIGTPGAGASPVRGHSNVQGDRTMGVGEQVPPAFLDALGTEFSFDQPRDHGADAVEAVHPSRGPARPVSENLLPEVAVVGRVARAALGDEVHADGEAFERDDDPVRERISRVVVGCKDHNGRIRQEGGVVMENGPRDCRTFSTPTGSPRPAAARKPQAGAHVTSVQRQDGAVFRVRVPQHTTRLRLIALGSGAARAQASRPAPPPRMCRTRRRDGSFVRTAGAS